MSASILSFRDVLTKFRKEAFSERDKGTKFERLMKSYLQIAPEYEGKFKEIWLWDEFPFRNDFSGKDTGIDLVAQTVEGDYWAIQCKCYDEKSRINKDGVDSFLATSSKEFCNDKMETQRFEYRLWISTTNNWNSEAERTIRNQNPPVLRISLSDLDNAPIDWEKLINGDGKALKAKYPLREHQKLAVEKTHKYFETSDRGKLIMACGTGKTFTSLKIAENETNLDDFAVAEGVRICRFGNFRVADGSVGDFFNGFFNHDIRLDRGGSFIFNKTADNQQNDDYQNNVKQFFHCECPL